MQSSELLDDDDRRTDLDGKLKVLIEAAARWSDGRLSLHSLSDRLGCDVVLTKVARPERDHQQSGVFPGRGDTAYAVDPRQVRDGDVLDLPAGHIQWRVRGNGE